MHAGKTGTHSRRFKTRLYCGFTLAELIVVITVLAILATIGFLALSGYSQDAKNSVVKTNVRSVYSAIMAESASIGKSPRYYVVHDSNYALSGGVVVFDGNAASLSGGDWDEPGTNYSAGNPDYAKLKLNKEKFRVSGFESWDMGTKEARAAGTANPDYLLVGVADFSETTPAGRPRVKSYVQVSGTLSANVPTVMGNYPVGNSTGSALGLIRDRAATSATGAIVDGIASGDPIPCVVPVSATHSSLVYALTSTGIIEHGTSETRTGSSAFGTSPANGTLTAAFTFSCSNGSVSSSSSNGNGACPVNYAWNSNWNSPSCTQSAFGFTQTINSNVANYNLKAQAIAAGWNQVMPLNANVTIAAGITAYASSPSVAAITVGTLPAGSSVNLVNNGNVLGAGGNGGNGNGNNGANGGDAITLANGVTMNVTNAGNVFGGGGGGGGGAVRTNTNVLAGGGGGGGGQGYAAGAGGAGGEAYAGAQYPYGYAGSAGTSSGPGAGGGPGNSGYYPNQWSGGYCVAGVGGNGGGWGAAGGAGGIGSGGYCPDYTAGNGGAGGFAIRLNGGVINWVSGNNSTQVKGTVN